MEQSAEKLIIQRYEDSLETAATSVCEDWILPEVDPHGHPVTKNLPDPGLLEEQFTGHLEEGARVSNEASYQTGYEAGHEAGHEAGYKTGYELGIQEGATAERETQRAAHAERLQRLSDEIGSVTEAFAEERSRFYERLEHEAVKLSLAVAGRILRREAQMDPLFLLGAVRVALGQLTASAKVRLRVPAADAQLWSEAMALLPNRHTRPEVIGADGMRVGQCVMETELGSADLGVRAQLGEIERALFDRAPSHRASEQVDAAPVAAGR
jgi:flagellar assembly protein FliH